MIVGREQDTQLIGRTEVFFKDLVAVVPDAEKVRTAYRAMKADKDKVLLWCERHFGSTRFNQDWAALFNSDQSDIPGSIDTWTQWIEAKPLSYRKVYYSPRVVAACIMGADE